MRWKFLGISREICHTRVVICTLTKQELVGSSHLQLKATSLVEYTNLKTQKPISCQRQPIYANIQTIVGYLFYI